MVKASATRENSRPRNRMLISHEWHSKTIYSLNPLPRHVKLLMKETLPVILAKLCKISNEGTTRRVQRWRKIIMQHFWAYPLLLFEQENQAEKIQLYLKWRDFCAFEIFSRVTKPLNFKWLTALNLARMKCSWKCLETFGY